ncbi:MAG: sulfite exporter TauE/SafE family protein [Actinomycetes bacterium]
MDHLSAGGIIILAVSALLAGAINAVAGGGTLLTFPALIAAGFAPITANVTNTVALVPGYIGGIAGYRRELEGQQARIRQLLPAAFLGSLIGAVLLLTTSERVFKALVPILVLVAAALLLLQPMIQRRLSTLHDETGERRIHDHDLATIGGVFLAAIYGGYFGGVLGVILLAVLGITLSDHLQKLNALKTVLQFSINIVAVVIFTLWGPIQWWTVLLMAPLTLIGGWIGAHFARGLHPDHLRRFVGVYGIVCAAILAYTLY